MNVFQLECFLSVAELLNFTSAASVLYITQPALSRAIASLENEMGVKLLERTTRYTRLTAAGEEFSKDCPHILQSLRNGISKAKLAADGSIGKLVLGFQRDTFETFTVEIVREFRRLHPRIVLEARPMGISEMLERVSNGTADAVVTAGHTTLNDQRQLLLKSRGERVVLPPDHPLASRESIRMEELRDEEFVVMSHASSSYGYDSVIDKSFEAGFTPNIVCRVDYVPAVLMLVACGQGISLLNDRLSVQSYGMVKFVPLECQSTFDRFLIWNGESSNPCLHFLTETAEAWLASCSV